MFPHAITSIHSMLIYFTDVLTRCHRQFATSPHIRFHDEGISVGLA
jgi:hypothetical protein